MHPADPRLFILTYLHSYLPTDPEELRMRDEMIEFISNHEGCFSRELLIGHVNGSALVVNQDLNKVLLNHHLQINRWFQFGGHSDGDPNTIAVGIREAYEETGLDKLEFLPGKAGIFDLDIHPIPARENIPEHLHYDIRILLVADENEPINISSESHEIKWVEIDDVQKYNNEPSILRMLEKVRRLTADSR